MSLFNRLFARNSLRTFNAAMDAFDSGDFETAVTSFRSVLGAAAEGSPGYILSRFYVTQSRVRLGMAFQAAGHFEEARATLLDVLKDHPTFPDVHCRLAEIALASGQHREADMRFKRALEINPYYGEALVGLAASLRAAGRHTEAIAPANTLAERGVAVPESWRAGRGDAEDEGLAHRLRQDMAGERLGDAHVRVGQERYRAGDLSGALAAFEAAIEAAPEFLDVRCRMATVLGELGRLGEAVEHFSLALDVNPAYEEARLKRGVAHFQLGHYAQAVEDFALLCGDNPTNPEMNLLLGTCLFKTGRTEEAIPKLLVAWKDARSTARAAFVLGQAFVLMDRPDRAIECLEPVPAPACQAMLGRVYLQERRYRDAIRVLNRARSAAKGNVSEICLTLAAAHAAVGDTDFAVRFAKEAHTSDPSADAATLILADIALRRGDADGAREWLDKLRPVSRAGYQAQLLSARALVRLGRYGDAKPLFEKLVEAYPSARDARRALGLLCRRDGDLARSNELLSAATADPADPLWGVALRSEALEEKRKAA